MIDLEAIQKRNEERRLPSCCLDFPDYQQCPIDALSCFSPTHPMHPPSRNYYRQVIIDIDALIAEVERLTVSEVGAFIEALEAADVETRQYMMDVLRANRCLGCGGPSNCYCQNAE